MRLSTCCVFYGLTVALLLSSGEAAVGSETCPRAAGMSDAYCDMDGDLVADLPLSPELWRDPATLVWAYAPIEDPAVYADLFKPFTTHLSACVGRQVVYYPVQSSSAQVEALRSGRIHFAGFSTGSTVVAVNRAGAVPFAAKGFEGEIRGYRLVAVVKADSPFQELSELRGRRVAHASPMSNSGNLAPRALFPSKGLVPDIDYVPIFSGSHDRSILGLIRGDYHMAAVASDVVERMIERGIIPQDSLRVITESALFPTSSFVHAHNLAPELSETLKRCFFEFEFPPRMQAEFNGDDAFLPLSYRDAWVAVREVMNSVGAMID